jgi:hypothetical protein
LNAHVIVDDLESAVDVVLEKLNSRRPIL